MMDYPWGDIQDYMDAVGARPSRGYNGLNMVMDCPWCGGTQTLYVLVDSNDPDERPNGSWVCYRCPDGAKSFWRLYAELEGIDIKAAKAQAMGQRMRLLHPGGFGASAHRALHSLEGVRKQSVFLQPPPPVKEPAPLPPGFIPVWDGKTVRLPQYLVHRRVTWQVAARYGLGYCDSGPWAHRIVFPVQDPFDASRRGFVTRAIRDEGEERRWISGRGASRMIFGLAQALPNETVGMVEGGFDVLGCARAAFPAIGIMGKGVPVDLVRALYQYGVRRIWLALDPDALADAIQGGLLAPLSDRLRVMTGLREGVDPGDADTAELKQAVAGVVTVEEAWSVWTKDRLGKIAARTGAVVHPGPDD